MKEKLTIAEELANKDIKLPSGFWWLGYGILARMPFFGPKYHPTYKIIDDINDEKGPAFIIWNHLSRRDYIFIKNIVAPRKFNMVAGYGEFFRSHLRPLFNKVEVIPKKNFEMDIASIRMMMKVIKLGGTIAFSPEGTSSIYGCNQPIVQGTGRFLKMFKVPVYFVKMEGQYLSSHKTCIDDRPGKCTVTISKLFSKEQLAELSGEAIDDKINEVFRHDDYEWNKHARVKYKTKGRAAVNMSTMAYKCPRCGTELEMMDNGNVLKCKHCGNGCTVNDYYDFIPFDDTCVIPESLTKWVEYERKEIIQEIRRDKNYSISYHAKIGELPKYKLLKNLATTEECGEGTITIDHNGIHFDGTRHGEPFKFDQGYEATHSVNIENDTTVYNLHHNGEMFDITPDEPQYVGKTLILIEEMHRLHVNSWKNFPWNDHLYVGTELEKK